MIQTACRRTWAVWAHGQPSNAHTRVLMRLCCCAAPLRKRRGKGINSERYRKGQVDRPLLVFVAERQKMSLVLGYCRLVRSVNSLCLRYSKTSVIHARNHDVRKTKSSFHGRLLHIFFLIFQCSLHHSSMRLVVAIAPSEAYTVCHSVVI